jgi:RNA 2',3'-cyclic 3'-phosphodiesterase
MVRTFIALELPLSGSLLNVIESFKKEVSGLTIKWVEKHNMHITLAFLGDTDASQLLEIADGLRTIIIKYASIAIHLTGIGIFGTFTNPKVVWIGITENAELNALAKDNHQLIQGYGFRIDNALFKPHLTLGRIKNYLQENNLKHQITRYSEQIDEHLVAQRFIFFESILTSSGPIYKSIREYKLEPRI